MVDIIEVYVKFGVDVNCMMVKCWLIDIGVIVSINKIVVFSKGKGGKFVMVYCLVSNEVIYF